MSNNNEIDSSNKKEEISFVSKVNMDHKKPPWLGYILRWYGKGTKTNKS